MILADKIINLRKKNGWTQEELAEKMNVSRQSVSKWEGAQSIPELNKILLLSEIFEVSIDYLLKDEIEEIEVEESSEYVKEYDDLETHKISLEEAKEFLKVRERFSKFIAIGVDICILSIVVFLFLEGIGIDEGISTSILVIMVTIAVAIFIYSASKLDKYKYIEEERIDTEYGVHGMVKEKLDKYRNLHAIKIAIGVCIIIISIVPELIVDSLYKNNETMELKATMLILIVTSIAVYIFITSGMKIGSMEMLLQEGDYSIENKKFNKKFANVFVAFWLIIVAIYLGYSLKTNNWGISWIIWPVAGILYTALVSVIKFLKK